MSKDRTAELFDLVSAIAREIGEFRRESNEFRSETKTRLERIEFDVRQIKQDFRILRDDLLTKRRKELELEDRIEALEGNPILR